MKNILKIVVFLSLLSLFGCSDSTENTPSEETILAPPSVVLTSNLTVDSNQAVTLTWQVTSGYETSVEISQLSGLAVSDLKLIDQSSASFVAPTALEAQLELVLRLTVTDSKSQVTPSDITITVNKAAPPSVVVQNELTVKSGAFVNLEWAVDSPINTTATLTQSAGEPISDITFISDTQAYFSAPNSFDGAQSVELSLVVKDANGLETQEAINIIVEQSDFHFSNEEKTLFSLPQIDSIDHLDYNFIDVDNDTITDLVVTQSNGLHWYKGKGQLEFESDARFIKDYSVESDFPSFTAFLDINNDGFNDVLFIEKDDSNTQLLALLNNQGQFNTSLSLLDLPTVDNQQIGDNTVAVKLIESNEKRYLITAASTLFIHEIVDNQLVLLTQKEAQQGSAIDSDSFTVCNVFNDEYPAIFFREWSTTKSNPLFALHGEQWQHTHTFDSTAPSFGSTSGCLTGTNKTPLFIDSRDQSSESNDWDIHQIEVNNNQFVQTQFPFSPSEQFSNNSNKLIFADINADNTTDILIKTDEQKPGLVSTNSTSDTFNFEQYYVHMYGMGLISTQSEGVLLVRSVHEDLIDIAPFSIDPSYQFWKHIKAAKLQTNDSISTVNLLGDFIEVTLNSDARLSKRIYLNNEGKVLSSEAMGIYNPSNDSNVRTHKTYQSYYFDWNNDGRKDVFKEETYEKSDVYDSTNFNYSKSIFIATESGIEQLPTYKHYFDNDVIESSIMLDSPRIQDSADINGDGYVDIQSFDYEWTTNYWSIFNPQTGGYDIIFNPPLSYFPPTIEHLEYVDINQDGLIDVYKGDRTTEKLYFSLQSEGLQFSEWADTGINLSINQLSDRDINLDGINELIVDRDTWLEFDNNNFIKHELNYLPEYTAFNGILDNRNKGEFYDISTTESAFIMSEFNEAIKQPVISQTSKLSISEAQKENHILFDIDGDNDSDIVIFDSHRVYYLENKTNQKY